MPMPVPIGALGRIAGGGDLGREVGRLLAAGILLGDAASVEQALDRVDAAGKFIREGQLRVSSDSRGPAGRLDLSHGEVVHVGGMLLKRGIGRLLRQRPKRLGVDVSLLLLDIAAECAQCPLGVIALDLEGFAFRRAHFEGGHQSTCRME
jgi:hypothetical protein